MPSRKQDAVQDIKDRLDLADLISEHLRLQKAGRDLKGLCPFHQEKTPSLYVSPEKQLWHCYGCQRGGDHFTFIQEIEHVDFKGALRLLAEKTGVELEEADGAGRRREIKRNILRLNQLASQYFHHVLLELPAGEAARTRLEERGITRLAMAEFQLGFAPAARHKDNLVRFLRKHDAADSELIEGGLAVRAEHGELWDRFRQRIMIPIQDERGELIAFGGRVMDESQNPKYLNTSQTALYDKSRVLFNLHRARKAIHEAKHAVLMEGYFDAITAWQTGVHNVVTTSGTALTEHQVRLLKRETGELLLAFDRDDAGRMATARAIEAGARAGLHIKVVRVPAGKDPDDFLRAHPDGWPALRERAVPEWEYLLKQALHGLDLTEAEDRRRGAEAVLPVLAQIRENSVLEIYAQQAAGWLRVDPAALLKDVAGLRATGDPVSTRKRALLSATTIGSGVKRPAGEPAAPPRQGRTPPAAEAGTAQAPRDRQPAALDEGYLLGLLLNRPELFEKVAPSLEGIEFSNPAYQALFTRLEEFASNPDGGHPLDRVSDFSQEEQRLIARAGLAHYPELEEGSEAALSQSIEQCLHTLQINACQRKLKAVEAALRQARSEGDESRVVALMEAHGRLARQREALKEGRAGRF